MFSAQTKQYLKIGLIAALVVLLVKYFSNVYSLAALMMGAAAPLLLGCVMAYILGILLRQVERFYFPRSKSKWVQHSRRPVCLVLAILLLLLILALVIWLVVPELISSITLLGKEIPPLLEKFWLWLIQQSVSLPTLQETLSSFDMDWPELLKKIAGVITTGAGGVINSVFSVVSAAVGSIANFVIGLIFALYLLASKEKLQAQCHKMMKAYLKPKTRERIVYILDTANRTFSSFIVGQCTEAVILGGLCTAGMLILRFPYAAMTGTVVGVTALIPIVGAYIGAAVGAFMIFTIDPFQALLFLIFLVVLQQLEGNLIYPRVVGTSVGLPGIWVLAAVTIGGGAMGIPGMLLGVPLAATVYKLLSASVNKKLENGKTSSSTAPVLPAPPVQQGAASPSSKPASASAPSGPKGRRKK